jgi:hypothetical protein
MNRRGRYERAILPPLGSKTDVGEGISFPLNSAVTVMPSINWGQWCFLLRMDA